MSEPLQASGEPSSAAVTAFAAFISYRHHPEDRQWAKWLQRELETFKTPRSLVRQKGLPRRIGKVFRDEEEIGAGPSLPAEIEDALRRSRFLIVVCSPRTTAPESRWIPEEIRFFAQLGRSQNVRALLIEGDPETSYPAPLKQLRQENTPIAPTAEPHLGGGHLGGGPVDADVRSRPDESPRVLKRFARLRLLAAILGCEFDLLRRREQERRMRQLAGIAVASFALAVVLTVLSVSLLRANREIRQAAVSALTEQGVHQMDQGEGLAASLALASAVDLDEEGSSTRRANRLRLALLRQKLPKLTAVAALEPGTGPASAVAFPRRSDRLLVGTAKGSLTLYDLSQSLPSETYETGKRAVEAVAIDPAGRQVAALLTHPEGKGPPEIAIWDTGQPQAKHHLSGDFSMRLCFSPGGRHLVATTNAGLQIIDTATGTSQTVALLRLQTTLAISPACDRVVLGESFENQVVVWGVDEGKEIVRWSNALPGNSEPGRFDPSGAKLYLVKDEVVYGQPSADLFEPPGPPTRTLRLSLWDSRSGAPLALPENFPQIPPAGPDRVSGPETLLFATAQGILVWRLDTGRSREQALHRTEEEDSRLGWMGLTGDRSRLVTRSEGGQVKLWDLFTGEPIALLNRESQPLSTPVWDASSRFLALPGADRVEVWDLGPSVAPPRPAPPPDFKGEVYQVIVARQARVAVAFLGSRQVRSGTVMPPAATLDFRSGLPLALEGAGRITAGLAVSPDGRWAAGGQGTQISLWDTNTGRRRHLLEGKLGTVRALAFTADSEALGALADGGLDVWKVAGGDRLQTMPAPPAQGCFALWSDPTGNRLVALNGEQFLLWPAGTSEPAAPGRKLEAHGMVTIALAQDAKRWALAAGDQIWLYGPAGTPVLHLRGHTAAVTALDLSPDGKVLASGSADRSVRLWEVGTGRLIAVLSGHETPVILAAFTSGSRLRTVDRDLVERLWDLSPLRTAAGAARGTLETETGSVLLDGGAVGLMPPETWRQRKAKQ